jgi:hypothetical protein
MRLTSELNADEPVACKAIGHRRWPQRCSFLRGFTGVSPLQFQKNLKNIDFIGFLRWRPPNNFQIRYTNRNKRDAFF